MNRAIIILFDHLLFLAIALLWDLSTWVFGSAVRLAVEAHRRAKHDVNQAPVKNLVVDPTENNVSATSFEKHLTDALRKKQSQFTLMHETQF